MSKWEKLLNRLLNLSSEMRFTELEKILISYGYEKHAPRSGSSQYPATNSPFKRGEHGGERELRLVARLR